MLCEGEGLRSSRRNAKINPMHIFSKKGF
jgi:hypothetical protein